MYRGSVNTLNDFILRGSVYTLNDVKRISEHFKWFYIKSISVHFKWCSIKCSNSELCPGGAYNFFLYRGGGSAPVWALKPPETHRFARSRGLSPHSHPEHASDTKLHYKVFGKSVVSRISKYVL